MLALPSQVVSAAPHPARAVYLGELDYGTAWRLQQLLVERRVRNECGDLLLLCQHPDVITVGRRQRAQANILDPRFPIFEVERGGDATYHGPGQLVGYPILWLRPGGQGDPWGERDLHAYLRTLEEALIALCAAWGVAASRREGLTGVWTADQSRKLASLGIAIRRWVSFHGFALNVTTELSHFAALNPCGLPSQVMTSLAAEGAARDGRAPAVTELLAEAVRIFSTHLRRDFTLCTAADCGVDELLATATTPAAIG
jgi:lipoyl(octanoyl) transferase